MPTPTNEVRVFLSSTFRDLNQEREVLMKKIFPDIKAVCRLKGITVTEVDLRWGITDEEATLGRIVRTCMEEIDRCRPYFIGFLGGRYGYIPDYIEISKDPLLLQDYAWIEDAVFDELSITEMEFRYGGLDEQGKNPPDAPNKPQPLFYFKHIAEPNEDTDRINALRSAIETNGLTQKNFADAEELGKMIYTDFIALIERDFPDAKQETELDRLRSYHRAFADSRRRSYIPNMLYLKQLNEFALSSSAQNKMLVYAASGAGKSSLMAFWADMFKKRNPTVFVVEHYVGIGAKHNDHFDVINHLLHEIKDKTGIPYDVPTLQTQVENALLPWLGYLKNQPLVWIIDSLDQLSAISQNLNWLPNHLPDNVKIILSTNAEAAYEKWQQTNQPLLTVAPITEREREAITVRYLSDYGKSLPTDLVKYLAKDEKNASPLYLKVLLEELRLHGQHESLAQHTQNLLNCPTTDALFEQVLMRLENSFTHQTVQSALSFIWVSRFGLNEEELAQVCNLPRVQLSALLSAFDYHLLRRNGLITFFHRYLRNAVEKRYLTNNEQALTHITQELTAFFEKQVHNSQQHYQQLLHDAKTSELSDSMPEIRHIKELAWLLEYSHNLNRLHQLVSVPEIFVVMSADSNFHDLLHLWVLLRNEGFNIITTYTEMLQLVSRQQYSTASEAVILRNVVNLFSTIGHFTEAAAAALQLLNLALQTDDVALKGIAYSLVGSNYSHGRNFKEAQKYLAVAKNIAEELADYNVLINTLGNMGNTYFYMGQLDEALSMFKQIETIQIQQNISHNRINNCISFSAVYITKGNLEEALKYLDWGLQMAEEEGDILRKGHILINIGLCYDISMFFTKALGYLNSGLEIAEKLGAKQHCNVALGALGKVHANLGNFEVAKTYLHQSLQNSEEINDEMGASIEKGWLSFIYEQEGNEAAAFECIEEAIATPRKIGQVLEETFWLMEKANLFYRKAHKSPPNQKQPLLRQALDTLEEAVQLLPKVENEGFAAMVQVYQNRALFELCLPDDTAQLKLLTAQMEEALEAGINDHFLPLLAHQQLWLMKQALHLPNNEIDNHLQAACELYAEKTERLDTRQKTHIKPLLAHLQSNGLI